MYSETVVSDKKDIPAVIVSIVLCIAAVLFLRYFIKNILLCDIITFTLTGIVTYKALTGCCSEFTYTVNNDTIILSRKMSSLNKHIAVNKSDITGIYFDKPKKFRASADFYKTFTSSGRCFIIYKDGSAEKTAVFAPSDTFVENMSVMGYPIA